MIFNKVTFTIEDEDFVLTMTPTNYYNTLMKDERNTRVYVSYMIELSVRGKVVESTVVHYYLSDGKTNTLRANLLFPFLYFDTKHDILKSGTIVLGSTYFDSDELVVKLQTVENIDLRKFELFKMVYVRQYTDDKLVGKYHPNPRDPSQSENIQYLEAKKPQKFIPYEHGAFTILSRLQNITDLILAVTCPEVIGFDFEAALQADNYLRYRPRTHPSEVETFNMDDYTKAFAYGPDRSPNFDFDDFMRLKKLQELQDLGGLIQKLGRLDVETINLEPTILTYEAFNTSIGVNYLGYTTEPQETLTPEFKRRVQSYNALSNTLADLLYSRGIKMILHPSERKTYELLDYLRRGWYIQHAYKKYLKYKAKYLKLKQSMKLS